MTCENRGVLCFSYGNSPNLVDTAPLPLGPADLAQADQLAATGPGLTALNGHQAYALSASGIYVPFP
jgi:hypothetical protein